MSYNRIPARIQLRTAEEVREELQLPDGVPVRGQGRAWVMGAAESWEVFLDFDRATALVNHYRRTGQPAEFRLADDGRNVIYREVTGTPPGWKDLDDAEAWLLPWDEEGAE